MNAFWQTNTIRLRAVEPSDAEIFSRWNLDSERARMLDFLWPPTSAFAQRAWTEEQSKHRLEDDSYIWVIETLECVPVGTISTHHCSTRNGTFMYGVDIAEEYRGHGFAAEAVKLVLRYYFHELRYHKVQVEIYAGNHASVRLHQKLGYTHEGTLREAQFTSGKHVDVYLYGLTRAEFDALYPEEP